MSHVLVVDANPARTRLSRVALGAAPALLDTATVPPGTPPEPLDGPTRVVHRFVHAPAEADEVVEAIEPQAVLRAGALEPTDTVARLAAWELFRQAWPAVPHGAVFDTAWFADLPDLARRYALPPALAAAHGLFRRGRHGPVHRRAAALTGAERLVSVCLDDDASVAALRDGRPIDITAGLGGVPGGTTVGDIDPAAVLHLVEELGLSVDEVEHLLRHESGLAGLPGAIGRRLVAHRVRRHVGAAAALLGGLDGLVVTLADPMLLDPEALATGLAHLGVGTTAPLLMLPGGLAVAYALAAS